MSEHTKGRLVVKSDWLIPADQSDRPIGGASNKERDRNHYANIVATVIDKYHDQAANAHHLAACWNAMDGVSPPILDCIVENGGVLLLLEKASSTERELAAARALLREVLEMDVINKPFEAIALTAKIREWNDVCDTLGGSV